MSELQRPPRPLYESRAVAMAMRILRLDDFTRDRVGDEHRSSRDSDNSEAYSFEAFNIMVPTFPVLLRTEVFTEAGPATARHLQVLLLWPRKSVILQRFAKVFVELSELYGERRHASAIGMHFPTGGLRGGMVIHNGPYAASTSPVVTIAMRKFGLLRLVSLRSLMLAVRRSAWSPTSSAPVAGQRVTPFHPAVIDRHIVSALGRGATAMVMNILAHAAEARAASEYVSRVEEREGVVWQRVDQATLARAIGRDARSVKQAVKELRDQGILRSRRDGSGNWYCMAPGWREQLAAVQEE